MKNSDILFKKTFFIIIIITAKKVVKMRMKLVLTIHEEKDEERSSRDVSKAVLLGMASLSSPASLFS